MKLVTWNVNGLRSCSDKGFMDYFAATDADVFCVQETKMQPEQMKLTLDGYEQYWNSAEKKGYSGTAVFSRVKPLSVEYGIGIDAHDHEGRVITLEFADFYLVNVYVPNSRRELERLDYRMEWEDAFRGFVCGLREKKPVVVCGDLNVAHREIDLKNPKTNTGNAGFTPEERAKLTELLECGFTDCYRRFYPEVTGMYTWWSYMFKAREKNAGCRIDYFLASDKLPERLVSCEIRNDIFGSDHCPVELVIDAN